MYGKEYTQLVVSLVRASPPPQTDKKDVTTIHKWRTVGKWRGVIGLAKNIYLHDPNPEELTFLEVADAAPLSNLTIKLLTTASFIENASAPSKSRGGSKKTMEPHHSTQLSLLTKDRKTWLRILHHKIQMRTWGDANAPYRQWGNTRDTHFLQSRSWMWIHSIHFVHIHSA